MRIFLFAFIKYVPAIVAITLVAIFTRCVPFDDKYDTNDVLVLTTSFLPMVFTILVVTLSRQNDNIYGMDSHDFRRYRRDIHFGLLEMTLIGVGLFITGFVFRMLRWFIPMWVAEGVSAAYCIYFLIQEIPVITNHMGYMVFLIGGIFRYEITSNKSRSDEIRGKKIENMAYKILEEKGIFEFYDEIKEK